MGSAMFYQRTCTRYCQSDINAVQVHTLVLRCRLSNPIEEWLYIYGPAMIGCQVHSVLKILKMTVSSGQTLWVKSSPIDTWTIHRHGQLSFKSIRLLHLEISYQGASSDGWLFLKITSAQQFALSFWWHFAFPDSDEKKSFLHYYTMFWGQSICKRLFYWYGQD